MRKFRIFILIVITLSLACLAGCKKTKDIYKGKTADQIYKMAKTNMTKESYAQAIKDYEALEARFPYGEYSNEAQLDLIEAYHKRSESALAVSAAERFIRMNPRHPRADYAYYLKGLVYYDDYYPFKFRHLPLDRSSRDPTSSQDAFDTFKELIERFPNSQYIADARKRMLSLRDQLAKHEYHVVDYYIKRGAYLSAANRANYIVKNFDQTSVIPKALHAMVISYRKLGMKQLADQAYQTLSSNFPKSYELRSLPKK